MSEKKSYTPAEIQKILRISHPTVCKLIAQKRFESVRFRRNIRIVKASFDRWLDGEECD
ncbi:MAG: helix-turn-helix domain-containing protein [Clostridia bacterium]|nr:helix-turn-helix domain-containing protein [Clostridia bacterium]